MILFSIDFSISVSSEPLTVNSNKEFESSTNISTSDLSKIRSKLVYPMKSSLNKVDSKTKILNSISSSTKFADSTNSME